MTRPSAPLPRPPACVTAAQLVHAPPRARVAVAGLVIVRQRPGSAGGVIFLTLEDETGVANVVVWKQVNERFRRAVIAGRLLRVTGRVQREGEGKYAVIHVVAEQIEDLSHLLNRLAAPEFQASGREASPRAGSAMQDEAARGRPASDGPAPGSPARHPRQQARKLFPSRDFH